MKHIVQESCIDTLLITDNADELVKFYSENFGLLFKELKVCDKIFYLCTDQHISIVSMHDTNCIGGIVKYNFAPHGIEDYFLKKNENSDLVYLEINLSDVEKYKIIVKEDNIYWATVLRAEILDRTKIFYKEVGQWQLEQHGNGPIHFYLLNQPFDLEIFYRTETTPSMQFFINKDSTLLNVKDYVYDLDGRSIKKFKDVK